MSSSQDSVIHRAAPGPKLLALIVLILAVSWLPLAGLALTAACSLVLVAITPFAAGAAIRSGRGQ